ncbi:hypothetical protein Tco_1402156 [Tanacetum coccineum]
MDYQCTQAEEIERQREYERLEIEREKSMQEFTDTFKEFLERMNIQRKEEEKRIFEEAARQEEEKRIAKEKEAAELEAKRKNQECFNIEEKSIPQVSTRSRKLRIDPTLSNFTVSTKRILLSDFEIPRSLQSGTVNSLSMGDKHLDTSKDSLESSVKDPIPIPSESNDTSNGARDSLLNDGKFQRALNDWCNLAQQNSMLSIYDENNKIRDCYKLSPSAITPDLLITDSLIMEDEHLNTIPVTESANIIKSSVDDLVPTPSESADFSDNESECDMPVCDDFMTFSNPLFDSNDDFTSSDDESLSDEDFDYLLEEFSGELAHIDTIPPGIEKADFDLEEEIRLVENLLYDNSSPRPPEEHNLEIADTIFESLSPSPILVEDSDSLMEEIDLFLASDDSMPPGIEDDDYDSEGDICFLEELLSMVGDNSEHDVLMPNLLPTQPTLCPVFDLLLPFSSENEDKVFNPGIFSSPFSRHRANSLLIFSERPMMISGGDIPHLDVPYLHFYPP